MLWEGRADIPNTSSVIQDQLKAVWVETQSAESQACCLQVQKPFGAALLLLLVEKGPWTQALWTEAPLLLGQQCISWRTCEPHLSRHILLFLCPFLNVSSVVWSPVGTSGEAYKGSGHGQDDLHQGLQSLSADQLFFTEGFLYLRCCESLYLLRSGDNQMRLRNQFQHTVKWLLLLLSCFAFA